MARKNLFINSLAIKLIAKLGNQLSALYF